MNGRAKNNPLHENERNLESKKEYSKMSYDILRVLTATGTIYTHLII